jgi:serine protease Do
MSLKARRQRGRSKFLVVSVLASLGLIAVLTFFLSNGFAGNTSETAWYADNPATTSQSSGGATIPISTHSQTAEDSAAVSESVHYGKMLSKAFHAAAMKVQPAVVTITNRPTVAKEMSRGNSQFDEDSDDSPFGMQGSPFGNMFKNNPELRRFFKDMPSQPGGGSPRGVVGTGSGVIVDPSGVVLTNNHVVAGGGKVIVRLQDGREFKATNIKADPRSDIAILHIEGAGKLPAVKLGNSDNVDIGDWVLALGQPFGLEGTVTAGIVSAKGRGLGNPSREEDYIQTDAAINPGNSGGPLIDIDGNVIGINTAISSSSGGNQGVGFAVPINLAKWIGGELDKNGTVRRAYLGVIIQPVTPALAEQFNVKAREGVLVTDVQPNSPAAKAGIQSGDVILSLGDKTVSSPRDLQSLVERAEIGSKQTFQILRDGKQMPLDVTVKALPEKIQWAGRDESPSATEDNEEPSNFDKLGISVEKLTPKLAKQLGVKVDKGVVITDVTSGSVAESAGLSAGMVISEVNRHAVNSLEDFRKALNAKTLAKGVLLLIRTPEGSRFVAIQAEGEQR